MKAVFRADSSELIGTGHVMRCLTLAQRLRANGATVAFVCRDFEQGGALQAKSSDLDVFELPFLASDAVHAKSLRGYNKWLAVDWERDARETIGAIRQFGRPDWLIVDHYAIDSKWEAMVRPYVGRILAIDDISNRSHECDLLLDHNYGHDDKRYNTFVPARCKQLLGTKYALLRDEFWEARKNLRARQGYIERVLVFYGGADSNNDTCKAMKALSELEKLTPQVDVVVGTANGRKNEIVRLAKKMTRVNIHIDVNRMSNLMASADLCLGAAGTTSWERCCMGLPTLMTAVADNQISIAEAIDKAGAGIFLGQSKDVTDATIILALRDLAISPRGLIGMSQCALALVDGIGTQRVMNELLGTVEAVSA